MNRATTNSAVIVLERVILVACAICAVLGPDCRASAATEGNSSALLLRIAALDVQSKSDIADQELIYLSDLLRGAVRRALPGDRFLLMTRENIAELLPKGVSVNDCIGDCAVTVGRKLGADYVVTSELFVLQGGRKLSLSLYSTKDSNLIASNAIAAADLSELEGKVKQSVAELLVSLSGEIGPGAQRRVAPAREDWQPSLADMVILDVVTTPPGATVLLDGSPFCSATPCRGEVAIGSHSIEAILSDYYSTKSEFVLARGSNRYERMELAPRFGLFDFVTDPSGVSLRLDGKTIGESPVMGLRVFPGEHYVATADERYKESGVQFASVEGTIQSIVVEVAPRLGAVQFLARDSLDQPVSASVTVDGKKVGETPVIVSLMVGQHEVVAKTGSESWAGNVVIGEKQELQETIHLRPSPESQSAVGAKIHDRSPRALRPGRWAVAVCGGLNNNWDVPVGVYINDPVEWSLGVHYLAEHIDLGVAGIGYFNGAREAGVYWANGALGVRGLECSLRAPSRHERVGVYGIMGAQVLTGSVTVGGWDSYTGSDGATYMRYEEQQMDGIGWVAQGGGGVEFRLGDAGDKGFLSMSVEYMLEVPWMDFTEVATSDGLYRAEGFSLTGAKDCFFATRVGLRWNWR